MTSRLTVSFLVAALAAVPAAARAQLVAEPYVSGLDLPVAFVQDPSTASLQYIVERTGRIRVVSGGVLQATAFLDLSSQVGLVGEQGLLGLAFPPDYGASRRFYVDFTNLAGDTVVARFTRSAVDPLAADPASRFDLRWNGPGQPAVISQPYSNHNGGNLAFGPDGYLYIGLGDGGAGNDPENRAQDPTTLLGKMLRIDVNVPDSNPVGYRVPPDNPFLDGVPITARAEIWAFGLRNPWRYSFDDPARGGTGALVIGDVGQDAWEEVDYEPAGRGGRNYGWRIQEGAHPTPGVPPTPPAYLPLTDPVFEYPHPVGDSITGGYVYRGTRLGDGFAGRYFFADFVLGRVWSVRLRVDRRTGEGVATDLREHTAELGGSGALGNISAFGVDAAGELYLVSYSGGAVLRISSPAMLTVTKAGSGTGTVFASPAVITCGTQCTAVLAPGAFVTLIPQAAPGSAFVGWGGDARCAGGQVTIEGVVSCTAWFQLVGVKQSSAVPGVVAGVRKGRGGR